MDFISFLKSSASEAFQAIGKEGIYSSFKYLSLKLPWQKNLKLGSGLHSGTARSKVMIQDFSFFVTIIILCMEK